MLTIIKVFIILYSYSACGGREHPGNFQNNSVNSSFNWISRYILFLSKLKGKERPFWKGAIMERRGTTLQDYNLVDIRHEKVSSFVKFEIILSLLCFLQDPLTNKHCRNWSSIRNLWIDSRTCQNWIILLTARPRFNYNYLELCKENVLRNMMLPHWSCFTWKFFMIWLHKILKLILKAAIMT